MAGSYTGNNRRFAPARKGERSEISIMGLKVCGAMAARLDGK